MKKPWQIIWHKEIDSTNSEASRRHYELDNMSVIAAIRQTAGRGQGDHKWHSKEGENLTFTVLLKYDDGALDKACPKDGFPAIEQASISQATALSVVDFLASKDVEAKIKLPNDIYVKDNKICGLLISHIVRAGKLTVSIIGVGININQTLFPSDLPNPTSLALESGRDGYDVKEELQTFLGCFEANLELIFTDGGRAELKRRFDAIASAKTIA